MGSKEGKKKSDSGLSANKNSQWIGMRLKESFVIFLKGLLMGTADIIPGVSGGTIALITGIYERLIFGIRNINFKFVPYALQGNLKGAEKNIKSIDFQFFMPLLFGIGLAFLTLSQVMGFLLNNFVAPTYAFIFGLILASSYVVYKHVDKMNLKNLSFLLLGFLFTFLFVGLEPLKTEHSLPVIFFSGVVAISVMLLPGISGAFALFLLNQYEYMLSALNNLRFPEIFTFIFGALMGALYFSKALCFLLERHKSRTMAFLVGVMLGALRQPLQIVLQSTYTIPSVIFPAALGFAVVFILEIKLGGFAKQN